MGRNVFGKLQPSSEIIPPSKSDQWLPQSYFQKELKSLYGYIKIYLRLINLYDVIVFPGGKHPIELEGLGGGQPLRASHRIPLYCSHITPRL